MCSLTRPRDWSALGRGLTAAVWLAAVALAAGSLLDADRALAKRDAGFAYSFGLSGPIMRGAQVTLERGLERARVQHASVVIVRLDTPGGLVDVTREMSKDIIAAPMPVIVYVHPEGATADSAGLFLTLSGDVAAMAPGTNIGSATPYRIGDSRNQDERDRNKILERKVRNDAIAWARALSERHGRNAVLAEQMVSKAANVSVLTAKRRRLIDVVAPNERALLQRLDGFQVAGPKAGRLQTAGLRIRHAANVEGAPIDSGASGDETSVGRTLGLILLGVVAVVLAIGAAVRGRELWGRRRWIWRSRRSKLRRARRR
jgi:membrane-bound serine protease (ClpP class)